MAPRSDVAKLLAAIEQVRDEARARDDKTDARFMHLERKVDEVVSKTDQNTKHIGDQAEALTRVASAAAKAADLALEAKQQAARAPDDTVKIVEGAVRIQSASIASTVDDAVTKALAPVVDKVAALERNDADRAATLGAQNAVLAEHGRKIDGVVTSVGAIASGVTKVVSWQHYWWAKAILAIVVLAGAAAGGFYQAIKSSGSHESRPAPIVAPSSSH